MGRNISIINCLLQQIIFWWNFTYSWEDEFDIRIKFGADQDISVWLFGLLELLLDSFRRYLSFLKSLISILFIFIKICLFKFLYFWIYAILLLNLKVSLALSLANLVLHKRESWFKCDIQISSLYLSLWINI